MARLVLYHAAAQSFRARYNAITGGLNFLADGAFGTETLTGTGNLGAIGRSGAANAVACGGSLHSVD